LQRESQIPAERAVQLEQTDAGLALVGENMRITCDFSAMLPRLAPGKLNRELLVRAAKMKGADRPTAIDATAGLGEDSLLLAAAGFEVQLFEQDEAIAALLEDGLARAANDPRLAGIVTRMHLTCDNSVTALQKIADSGTGAPDVVYLDPMFPERSKSASVKKKFQLLHHLEAPCANEEELLRAAIAAKPRKVVVKRPAKGALLAGVKPGYSIAGKAVRYDVFTPASIKLK
jgi:16S rRNA (guanine1516-N2)-methyltransferase